MAFLKENLQYLTVEGQRNLLVDGGAAFLHQVQSRAEFNSTFWAAGGAIIGPLAGAGYQSTGGWGRSSETVAPQPTGPAADLALARAAVRLTGTAGVAGKTLVGMLETAS